jgi:hypothetical protein
MDREQAAAREKIRAERLAAEDFLKFQSEMFARIREQTSTPSGRFQKDAHHLHYHHCGCSPEP